MGTDLGEGYRSPLVGRERELGALDRFLLDEAGRPAALLLDGPPGIGKTSVWEAGVAMARRRAVRTLVTRVAAEDAQLGLAGLCDLFEAVPAEAIDELAAPQARALRAALLIEDTDVPAEPRALYLAVVAVLRRMAEAGPVVVAIDDLQWLDPETSAALAFAARRLDGADVRLLLTRRAETAHRLEELLRPERLTVGPLSFGATCKLIHDRLGIGLYRATARRLHETTGGNPLFGLELARALAARGLPIRADEPFPLPESVDALLSERVAGLHPEVRTALLAVAVSPGARAVELVQVVGEDALEDAVRAGLVVVEREHVRCAHPLLGEAARIRTRASERRELHARLAAVVHDEQRRALHLAKAVSGADGAVADEVAVAAERAAERGALTLAVELGERALGLTPAGDPAADQRLLDAAELNLRAGRLSRVGELLEPALDDLAEGSPRARAMVLLASAVARTPSEARTLIAGALAQEPGRTRLRTQILIQGAIDLAVADVEQLALADAFAGEGLEIARQGDSFADQHAALGTLMWIRALRGQPLDDLLAARGEIPEDPAWIYRSVDRIALVATMWRGELVAARRGFGKLLRVADERGELESYFALRVHLCELELRAGRWDAVDALLGEWETDRGDPQGHGAALLRCRALVAAGRGDVDGALANARRSIEESYAVSTQWHRLEALRARGLAQLLAGEPAGAAGSLGAVWAHLRAEGVENPGAFPVAPDLAQALVASGSVMQAANVADALGGAAEAQDHPWARAAGARAQGWASLGRGDVEPASAHFAEAVERFEALGLLFDAARARGELGAAQRRMRRKSEARESLERAAHELEELGSLGWARTVHAELGSLGGRPRSAESELTATERRVADLVAQGLANKEVAASLVVTVSAVEAHLTRIYAKLGIRSRAELARTYHG